MPIGMRRMVETTFFVPTASGSLVETAGGYNPHGYVAVDLTEGDGTGYTNYWQERTINAQFIPGIAKRYDQNLHGYKFLGECSIKIESKYDDLVSSATHLKIGSVEWNFQRISELGAGFGNDRIVLALTRK